MMAEEWYGCRLGPGHGRQSHYDDFDDVRKCNYCGQDADAGPKWPLIMVLKFNIAREARSIKTIRRRFFHLQGGNWWRWPAVLMLRLPLALFSKALTAIAETVEQVADAMPGVSERTPTPKGPDHG